MKLINTIKTLALAVVASFAATGAWATTVAQIGTMEYDTLEAALQAANSGNTVNVIAGEVEIPATVVIPADVTLSGAGKDQTTLVITTTNGDGLKITQANVKIQNLTIDGKNITSSGYNSLVNVEADGCVIDNVIMTKGGASTWNSSILIETLNAAQTFEVKNSSISGSFRGVLRESCSANIVITNCDIAAIYPFNIDGGNGGTVTVNRGALHGWTSYSSVDKVTFNNVAFSKGSYDVVAAYSDTDFNGCTFDSDLALYNQTPGFTWNVDAACTKAGVPVTAANFKELFSDDPDVWNKSTANAAVAVVNGTTYYSNVSSDDGTKPTDMTAAVTAAKEAGYQESIFYADPTAALETLDPTNTVAFDIANGYYQISGTVKDEIKIDVSETVVVTVVDASGEALTATEAQQTAADNKKTVTAEAIAANTVAASKTGTGLREVDESAYLKIALTSTVIEVVEDSAALKTLVFDVTPYKVTETTENEQTTKTEEAITAVNAPITFRLPLTDDFTISALITHEGDDDRVVPVQGTSGQKYVELTFTHFSEVTATPTDKVESSIASTEQLGIIRYAPTDLYTKSDEVAVGVPWLSTSSTDASDVAVTVAELIATGLTSGDQISVWDKANKRYDVWQWNGSSWVAALDADSGSTTTKSAYTTKVERGQAFWYKRNDKTKTFALIGRPKDNATTTPEVGQSKNPKYNLMSNPYPDAIDLAGLTGTEGDQIVTIPDGTFYTYTTAKVGWCTRKWVEDESVTLPWLPGNHHPVREQFDKQDSLVIPSGRSFWYISKGGAPAIDWKSLKVN